MSFGAMKINGLQKQCFGADHAAVSFFSTARFYRRLCWLFFYSIPSALYDKTTHHFKVICLNDRPNREHKTNELGWRKYGEPVIECSYVCANSYFMA